MRTEKLSFFYKSAGKKDGRATHCKACFARRRLTLDRYPEHLSWKFGIGKEDYKKIVERFGGQCAICQAKPTADKNLCLDHCHKTGWVRGLLCRKCNTGIGQFGDEPDLLRKALNYLGQPVTAWHVRDGAAWKKSQENR